MTATYERQETCKNRSLCGTFASLTMGQAIYALQHRMWRKTKTLAIPAELWVGKDPDYEDM